MSIPMRSIVLIVALFASLSSPAQGLFLGFESNITLKQDDIDLIHQTVDQKIHGQPVGTTAFWNNPNTGNAGTIQLVKKFTKKNLHCERVAYTLTTATKAVEPEHYVFDSCLTRDGWKIAQQREETLPSVNTPRWRGLLFRHDETLLNLASNERRRMRVIGSTGQCRPECHFPPP